MSTTSLVYISTTGDEPLTPNSDISKFEADDSFHNDATSPTAPSATDNDSNQTSESPKKVSYVCLSCDRCYVDKRKCTHTQTCKRTRLPSCSHCARKGLACTFKRENLPARKSDGGKFHGPSRQQILRSQLDATQATQAMQATQNPRRTRARNREQSPPRRSSATVPPTPVETRCNLPRIAELDMPVNEIVGRQDRKRRREETTRMPVGQRLRYSPY